MILPLRRRHRRMFAVIGVLLPVAFIAGVAARKPIPTAKALPNTLPSAPATFSIKQWERDDLFSNIAVRVQLLREASNANRTAIQISTPKDFVKADLLLYWAGAELTLKDKIPDDAVLVGAFLSGQPLSLPPVLTAKPGSLVLYSLADQEIIGISQQLSLR